MAMCAFCGAAVPDSPQTYVESTNVERELTELMRACTTCAGGFPTKFTVK